MLTELSALFLRDLDRLRLEVLAFESEDDLWVKKNGISNSAGNLALLITGNLQHFIGHILGKSSYIRNREAEFNTIVTRAHLLAEIENTKAALDSTFKNLNANTLNANYPIEVFGNPMTTQYFLIHLSGHLNYHLGQINYYRRLN